MPISRFTDDQYDPELAATIGVDFKVKVRASFLCVAITYGGANVFSQSICRATKSTVLTMQVRYRIRTTLETFSLHSSWIYF
jgi:hypothetical protein